MIITHILKNNKSSGLINTITNNATPLFLTDVMKKKESDINNDDKDTEYKKMDTMTELTIVKMTYWFFTTIAKYTDIIDKYMNIGFDFGLSLFYLLCFIFMRFKFSVLFCITSFVLYRYCFVKDDYILLVPYLKLLFSMFITFIIILTVMFGFTRLI